MKVSSIATLGLILGLGFSATGWASQFDRDGDRRDNQRDNQKVCFYQDANYQGWEQCYSAGDEVSNLGNRKNAISSIRFYGRNLRVIVYDDESFRGRSAEFSADVSNLDYRTISDSKRWNDHVRSLRIVSDVRSPQGSGGRQSDPREPRDGICVYEHAAFQGRSYCWSEGEEIRDLARLSNWNDRISSIRLFGRARVMVFRDSEFRGENLIVDRDIADLARLRMSLLLAWNDQISSLRVENTRGRGPGPGR